jgi:YgiT-type zinc finger domain-containing protein
MKFENCSCRNTKPEKITKEISIGTEKVLVQDAPARVCLDCGEIYFDGKYIMELTRKVRKKLQMQPA